MNGPQGPFARWATFTNHVDEMSVSLPQQSGVLGTWPSIPMLPCLLSSSRPAWLTQGTRASQWTGYTDRSQVLDIRRGFVSPGSGDISSVDEM